MRSVTVSATIDRPIEEVYDFLLDSRNDELWCPLASDVVLVDGEPGVGASYRFTQGQGPGLPRFTAWSRTIEAVRPSRIVWDNADRGNRYRATIDLSQRGARTKVRHTNEVHAPNLPQQLVWFLGANAVLRMQLRNLDKVLSR